VGSSEAAEQPSRNPLAVTWQLNVTVPPNPNRSALLG